MALTVTISGPSDLTHNGQGQFTATVIDTDTNAAPVGTVVYRWSADSGSFVGATDGQSATYHADQADNADASVTITCAVDVWSVDAPSLTAMTTLGITGQLVNMFFSAVSDLPELYHAGAAGTLDTNSDADLTDALQIARVRWGFPSARQFLINRLGTSTDPFSGFWDDAAQSAYSAYLILDSGAVFEMPGTWLGTNVGQGFARWSVPSEEAQLVAALDAIEEDDELLFGIADAGSITTPGDTGSATAALSVTENEAPSITITAPARINPGEDTQIDATITDPEGATYTILWTAEDSNGDAAGSFDDTAIEDPTFTAPATAGALTLTVTATDAGGASGNMTHVITVNAPPVVVLTAPNRLEEGQGGQLTATVTDDHGAVTVAWTATAGTIADSTALQTAFTAPFAAQTVTVTCTATDSEGLTATATASIAIAKPLFVVPQFRGTQFGADSYVLAAKQTEWDTKATSIPNQKIFEIVSCSIAEEMSPIEVARSKGNPSPTAPERGFSDVTGDIVFNIMNSHLGLWLKNLLDADPDTTPFAGGVVYTAAAITNGTAIGTVITPFTASVASLLEPPVDAANLKFTFDGTTGAGTLTIVGTDSTDTAVTETLAVADGTTEISSDNEFKTVTTVTPAGFTTPGELKIELDSGMHRHVFDTTGTDTDEYLTIEVLKGRNAPTTYSDIRVNNMTLNFGDVLNLTFGCFGNRAFHGQSVAGTSTPTSLTGFTRPDGRAALGWGTQFTIDDTLYAISSASFEFNQSLEYPETENFGLPYRLPLVRTGNRVATLSATPDFIPGQDYANLALGGTFDVSILAVLPTNDKYSSIEFRLPQARMTSIPDPEIAGQGLITKEFTFQAFGTTNDEVEITVINSEDKTAFLA